MGKVSRGLTELLFVKCLEKCLAHSKHSILVSYYLGTLEESLGISAGFITGLSHYKAHLNNLSSLFFIKECPYEFNKSHCRIDFL